MRGIDPRSGALFLLPASSSQPSSRIYRVPVPHPTSHIPHQTKHPIPHPTHRVTFVRIEKDGNTKYLADCKLHQLNREILFDTATLREHSRIRSFCSLCGNRISCAISPTCLASSKHYGRCKKKSYNKEGC